MIDREQLINEIAEVVNRNSMEKAFNDTPDFILARIAVEAMEMFTRASAHRDDYHGLERRNDRKYKAICESEKKAKPVNTCKGLPAYRRLPRRPNGKPTGTQKGVQETGGARRPKRSGSNGGFLC